MMMNLAIRICPLAAGLIAASGGLARPMPDDTIADTARVPTAPIPSR
jgi:hypothetical protein